MTEKLRVEISAEDRFGRTFANLRRDLSGARDQFGSVAAAAAAASSVVGRIALGGVAGAAGFGAGIRMLANDIDALNDSADATGATVEQLSALERVALRNGGTLELVTSAVLKLNKVLSEAKADSPAAQALQALGLKAEELRQQDPAAALQQIAVALAGFADNGNKARIVQELFGKSTKEVAAFLKDMADAGELVATTTAKQAEEAERFNKALFDLQANSALAGRALVSSLLPTLNEVFIRLNAARESFGSVRAAMMASLRNEQFADAAEGVSHYTAELAKLQDRRAKLAGSDNAFARLFADTSGLDEQIAKTRQLLDFYTRVGVATQKFAGGGRGFVNPDPAVPRPSLRDLPSAPGKTQVSEAQRYLETLQRQAEGLENQRRIGADLEKIDASRQLQLDLQAKRIDGITPALERQLKAEATRLDTLREIDRLKEREANFQKLINDLNQKDIDRGLSLMQATPTGQLDRLNADADAVLRVSRANPDDPRVQRMASEALAELRRRQDDIINGAEKGEDAFDRLADTIEKGMDRATSAVLDFAIEGKGGLEDVGRAFARDIARGLLEEPIRDEVKRLGKSIADTLRDALKGEDIFGPVLKGLKDLMSNIGNTGSSGGGWLDTVVKWWGSLGGGTTRAMGGGVRAGQLVRWQENGREWFVPQHDGSVMTQQQLRAAGGAQVNYAPVFHVNGDVSPQTVAMMRNMVAADRAQFVRQLRTGAVGV